MTVWPGASVPDDGKTLSLSIPVPGLVMDQVTGPFEALKVREPPRGGVRTIVVGVTVSVPCAGGGEVVLVLLVDDAGELGVGLVVEGLGKELGVALGELAGELPAGDGKPPARGMGATGVLANAAGRVRCGGLPVLLGLALDVAPVLVLGADPVPNAAAARW